MGTEIIRYYENYTPVADITVIATCIVFVILIYNAYINKNKSFLYLRFIIGSLAISAAFNLLYHIAMNYLGGINNLLIYMPRAAYHIGLFTVMWLYVLYAKEVMGFDKRAGRPYFYAAAVAWIAIFAYETFGTYLRLGFYIDDNLNIHRGFPIFPIGYIYYVVLISVMVFVNRGRFIKQVIISMAETIGVSVVIMGVQQLHNQSSFTTVTFLFPIYALLYHIHSSPYDVETGSVSEHAFFDLVELAKQKNEEYYFMSMYMHDFEGKGRKYPRKIQQAVRYFSTRFFKSATLFQISGGHMILVVSINKNPGYMERSQWMLDEFLMVYPQYRIDYKIVFFGMDKRIEDGIDYINFVRYIHDSIPQNTIVRVEKKDVDRYTRNKYIVFELEDIIKKNDLNDPRVLVYCQPVYNIRTGKFDTAEALMRMQLPAMGMVYPDLFIPIAEKKDYIGMLTKIILSKTCRAIKDLLEKGYNVKRISVNFSVYDMRADDFCEMVETIIGSSGVPFDKVAIELTESQNEQDFELIKKRINELKGSGIKFYLDDFGTGYSNFERIMELPFDIVKFDRSLVMASGNDERYRTMVSNLARMFREVHYSVLYEGIENEDDEKRCIEMSAKYLQGYKYSKPIPIERLTDYFEKIG